MPNVDYIVVGKGLGGSLLAWNLIQRKKKICLIDAPNQVPASEVAAGMFNPLVFKRVTKSWLADELLPVMKRHYETLESYFGLQFLCTMDILKLLNEEEIPYWQKCLENGKVAPYLKEISQHCLPAGLKDFAAAARISNAGFLKTGLLLSALTAYFHNMGHYEETQFRYNDLAIYSDSVEWHNYRAERIVFCEGAWAVTNPYFDFVPYYLTKGDLLQLSIPGFQQKNIISKDIFIVPRGENNYLLGSTYIWSGLNFEKDAAQVEVLKQKLENIIDIPYKIINHLIGVRPTLRDRRPVLGVHPTYPQLAYFNGLGTKGIMQAPYFAEQMVSLLEDQKLVHEEVKLERYQTSDPITDNQTNNDAEDLMNP